MNNIRIDFFLFVLLSTIDTIDASKVAIKKL